MNRITASSLVALAALTLGSGCNAATAQFQDGGGTPDAGPEADAGHPPSGPHFGTPIVSGATYGVSQMVAADFNGDGTQDLVVAVTSQYRFTGHSVEFLAGYGDGTFQSPVDLETGTTPEGLAVLDIDGDGHPDFAVGVCADAGSYVSYFLSSDGGFGPRTDIPVSSCPYALAVADLNGDGRPDLAAVAPGAGASTTATGEVDILYAQHGTLAVGKTLATDAPAVGIASADLNGDHIPDLAVTTTGTLPDGSPDAKLLVWLGASDGTLQTLAPLSLARGGYRAISAGDLDGDGHQDLVLVSAHSSTLAVLLGKGDGTFQPPTYQDTSGSPVAVGLGDFTLGGWLDVAAAEANISPFLGLSVFPGGGKAPAPIGAELRLQSDGETRGLAIADFNGDGRPDIALSVINIGSVAVIPALGGPPLLPDAATFKTADHVPIPIIPDQGGPLLDRPDVITLTFQDDPTTAAYQAYNDWIVGSDWLATIGTPYGIGLGTNTNIVIQQNAPTAILDSEIQTLLVDLILDGGVPSPTIRDGGLVAQQLYFVYFPNATTISGPGLGTSCNSFGGYHSENDLTTTPFAYAVVPTCYPNYPPVQQEAASHELAEACSDPLVASHPAYTTGSSRNAGLIGEIADVCNGYSMTYALDGGSQVVAQRIWSNDAAQHDLQPCIPALAGPYANVSPDQSGATEPNRYRVPAGGSISVTLTGWTNVPSIPFGVLVSPYLAGYNQATFYPGVAMTKANLANGEHAALTISVPAGTAAGSMGGITIYSGFNDDNYAFWPLLVYVP